MPRLHHSSDCSTVSTFCTDNDLGSRVYNGIYRFSCYLTSTELEGDIGLSMSVCSAAHHSFEFSARLQTNWWLWAFTGLINFWSRSAQSCYFLAFDRSIIFRSLGQNNCEPPQPVFTGGHCSGSLEPESSCHDRDWIMELPMEADILIFTGILTPEDASVASCCSASGGSFWDRPPGCACLFWIQSGRGLDCSTSPPRGA